MANVRLSLQKLNPLVLSITREDVVSCISKNIKSYSKFLDEELENKEITQEEYQRELTLINNIETDYSNSFITELLSSLTNVNIIICDNDIEKTTFIELVGYLRKEVNYE